MFPLVWLSFVLLGICLGSPSYAGDLPAVAIIIDDLGNKWRSDTRAVRLPGPVAVSVLPRTPYSHRIANYAHSRGITVMMHLPLASLNRQPLGEGSISLDTTESEFAEIWQTNLRSVPHVSGINNHMGSLLTQHPGHMRWLMQAIQREKPFFFVDSYTTHHSVALRLADEFNIPAMKRDVFLDAELSPQALDYQFQRLKRLSRKNGVAVAIAHPHNETLRFLESKLPTLESDGYRLVDISVAIDIRDKAWAGMEPVGKR